MANKVYVPPVSFETGVQDLNISVPKIKVPTAGPNALQAPTVTNTYHIKRKNLYEQANSRLLHPTDLGDIILGNPISGTKQLQNILKDNSLDALVYIPVLNRVVGTYLTVKERVFEPMIQGDTKTLTVNFLETMGNTADTLSNVVKSLIPVAGGGTLDDLQASLGLLEGEYRKQYKWNTSHPLINFVGEVLSDPTNWIQLTLKAPLKTSTNVVTQQLNEMFIRTWGKETMDKIPQAVITDYVNKYGTKSLLYNNVEKLITQIQSEITSNLVKDTANLASKTNIDNLSDVLTLRNAIKNYTQALALEIKPDDIITNLEVINNSSGWKSYLALRRPVEVANTIDSFFLRAGVALASGGISVAFNRLAIPLYKSIHNKIVSRLNTIDPNSLFNDPVGTTAKLDKEYYRSVKAAHNDIHNSLNYLLKNYKLDTNKLINKWREYYSKLPASIAKKSNITNKLFIDYLKEQVPVLSNILYANQDAILFVDDTIGPITVRMARTYVADIIAQASEIIDVQTDTIKASKSITSAAAKQLFNSDDIITTIQNRLDTLIEQAPVTDTTARLVKKYRTLSSIAANSALVDENLNGQLVTSYQRMLKSQVRDVINYLSFLKNNGNIEMYNAAINSLTEIGITKYTIEPLIQLLAEGTPSGFSDANLVTRIIDLLDNSKQNIHVTNKAIKNNLNFAKNSTAVSELISDLRSNGYYKFVDTTTNKTQQQLENRLAALDKYQDAVAAANEEMTEAKNAVNDINILIESNIVDLNYIDTLCDTYAGTSISESDLSLTNLFEKIKSNIDLKTDNISYNNLLKDAKTLRQRIHSIKQQLDTGIKGITRKELAIARKQLYTIEPSLDQILNKKAISTFAELAHMEDEALYVFKISNPKMFEVVFTNILSTASMQIKGNLISDLLNSSSPIREHYAQILGELYKTNNPILMHAANVIKELFGVLDSSNAIMTGMREARELFSNLKLSQNIKDTAASLFYDLITSYKYRDVLINNVDDHFINELVTKFTQSFDQMWGLILKERYEKLGVEYLPGVVNEMFQSEVSNLFRQFINTKRALVELTGTSHALGSSVLYMSPKLRPIIDNANTLDLTNAIGDYFGDVVKAMDNKELSVDVGSDVINLITNITGHYRLDDVPEIKNIRNEVVRAIVDASVVKANLDPTVHNLKELVDTEQSLAYAISDAFKAIREMNLNLKEYGYVTREHLTEEMIKQYKEILATELGYEIAQENIQISIENWINLNGTLGVKKAYDNYYAFAHKIQPYQFKNIQGASYQLFYNNFTTAYREVSSYAAINRNYVNCIRQVLNELNEDPSFMFYVPASDYFDSLNEYEIRTYALLLNSPKFYGKIDTGFTDRLNELISKQPDLAQRAEYYTRIDARYVDLETINSELFSQSTAYDPVYNVLVDEDFGALIHVTSEDLLRIPKDPTSLTRHTTDITRYIQQDVKQYSNSLLPLDSMSKRPISNFIKSKKKLETLHNIHGIAEDAAVGNTQLQNLMKREREVFIRDTVTRLNAKQLRSWIDDNTDGALLFLDKDRKLINNLLAEDLGFGKGITSTDLKPGEIKLKVLKDAKLRVWQVSDDLFFIRRTTLNAPHVAYDWIAPSYILEGPQRTATNSLKSIRSYINYDTITIPEELFTGDMIDREVYETILKHPNLEEMVGALEEQKLWRKLDKFGNGTFYTSDSPRPNLTIIGDPDAFNEVLRRYSSYPGATNIISSTKSTKLYNSVARGVTSAIKRVNNEHKYLTLFMNDDYFLGNNVFTDMMKNFTDKELEEVFSRNNWEAVLLRESNGKPAVYKIYIRNRTELNEAIKAGAICVPHEIYRNMVLTINKHKLDSKLLNLYRQSLVSTYKTIYLTSPGFLLRNGIDSLINKNAGATDGISSIISNFGYEAKAARLLAEYEQIQQKILKLAKSNNYPTINRYYTQQVLKTLSKEAQQRYIITDLFINSPASGGLARSLQEALVEYNNKDLNKYLETHFLFQKVWDETINAAPYIKQIRDINDWIEQTARYSLFLNMVENGGDYTAAVREVIGTHFDYDLFKAEASWMEQIFWFSTFPINNYLYYVNEGLTKNPDLIKTQLDLMQASWNTGDYTWDDIKKSGNLTYNAAAGNIRVKIGDKNFVIKTGSSLFDFFNLIFNPVDAVKDRLNPFLSVLFGFDDPSQLSPFTTWGSKYKQIKEGRSYVPSVYAELLQYQPAPRKHQTYTKIYNSSSWRPRIRRPRRSYNARVYTKRISQKYPYHRSLMSIIKQYLNRVEPMGAEDSKRYQTAIRRWKNTRFRKTTRPIKYSYGQLRT